MLNTFRGADFHQDGLGEKYEGGAKVKCKTSDQKVCFRF